MTGEQTLISLSGKEKELQLVSNDSTSNKSVQDKLVFLSALESEVLQAYKEEHLMFVVLLSEKENYPPPSLKQ